MKNDPARTRLQVEFTEEALTRVETMRSRTGARSSGEVVRNALRIYEWLLKQQDEGFRVQLTNDKVVREIELILG